MAYATSNKYKQFIYNEDSKQSIEIIINGNTIDGSYIRSFKLTDEIFEEEIFSLGSAITSKYILELNNEALQDITSSFDAMTFVFKLETDSGIEVVPMGRYIIKEKDESSSYFTKFTLYDYMDKFDVVFDASGIVPCTRYELLQAICEYCGVELENESILNGDVEVGVYDNTISAKTYLSLISERAGGFAKINRNNKLVIKTLSDVDTIELPNSKVGDYTTNELKIVTRIVYENATQKFESGTDDGVTIYLSQDSPFSCSQQEVDNILQKLKGLQYQTLDVRVWGDPSIDTGDIITFDNIKSFAQKDWSFGNGFYGSYKTILNDSQSTLNVSKLSGNTKRKRLESRINEAEGTIKLLSEEVAENSEKVSQFQIDLDGITSSVSKTEEMLDEMSKAIQEFSTDLEMYNLIIPVDESKKPLETKEYTINHYSYFRGKQIEVVPSTTDTLEGITVAFDKEKIKISVNKDTTIPNLNNELSLDFAYTDENDEVYYLSKKIVITLSQKGADGQDAPIPKIIDEQEGKSLYVEASENNAIEFRIDGKSEQETRSGKNLFKMVDGSGTLLGLTYKKENGQLIINGTSDGTTGQGIYMPVDITLDREATLTLNSEGTHSGMFVTCQWTRNGVTKYEYNKNFIAGDHITQLYVIVNSTNASSSNWTVKPQLEFGTSETDYELYGASPSPDYPSEIKSICGIRNLCKEMIIFNTETQYSDSIRADVELKSNTEYTIIFESDISGNLLYPNENLFTSQTRFNTQIGANILHLVTKNVDKSIVEQYSNGWRLLKNAINNKLANYTNLMIIEGYVDKASYVPYGSWSKVKISGNNILNYNEKYTNKFQGYWAFQINIPQIKLKANTPYYSSLNARLVSGSCQTIQNFRPNSPNNEELEQEYINRPNLTNEFQRYVLKITPKVDIITDKFVIQSSNASTTNEATIEFSDFMVSTIDTEYEPYKEQEVLIDLNKPNSFDYNYFYDNYVTISNSNIGRCVLNLEKNTNYTILHNIPMINETSGKVFAWSGSNTSTTTVTTTNGVKPDIPKTIMSDGEGHIVIAFYTEYGNAIPKSYFEDNTYWIKIYKGTNTIPYYEISSLPDGTKDTLDIVDGQVVLNKNVRKINFSDIPSNTIYTNDTSISEKPRWATTEYFKDMKYCTGNNNKFLYSRYLESSTPNKTYTCNQGIAASGKVILFYVEDTYDYTKLNEFLKKEDNFIYYPLENTEQIILPTVNIPLYEGVNHVELVEDLETNIYMKYYTPYKGAAGKDGRDGEKGEKGDKGDPGIQGLQGLQGPKGEQGIQGPPGETGKSGTDGKTSYFHIKYSSKSNPTSSSDMTETPNTYIGTYVDFIEDDSTDPTKYTWSQFKGSQGPKGEQGIAGTNGENGKTSYLHIAYATSSDGKSGFSISDSTNKTYIGQYTDFTENDSTDYTKYKWSLIKGAKGDTGAQGIQGPKGEDGTSSFFHVRYSANSNGNPMTETPASTTQYMGVASTTSPTAPTSYSAYTWSKIKGENGTNGSPGKAGTDGKTSYLHIKYSEDGKAFTPADEEQGYALGEKPSAWYGQYVDFTQADSTKFSDYKWYKFTENIDGTLSDLQKQIDTNSNEMVDLENDLKSTNEKFNDYAREDSVVERLKTVDQKINENALKITSIDEILVNGVTKVKTETGYTFDKDGLKIQKSGSEMNSLLDNDGLVVKRNNDEMLTVRSSGVETENLKVRTYLYVGNNLRVEDYDGGTGFFYVGGGK